MNKSFFRLPTLGGYLVILNCMAWLIFFYGISIRPRLPDPAVNYLLLMVAPFTLPFAWMLLVPSVGGGPTHDTVPWFSL